ncbi:MAG: hypothetical protein JWN25_58 [Verrucomicrobiales bacterium]|nr:hypothetical protein [Verrucomicrobiales bacterium]
MARGNPRHWKILYEFTFLLSDFEPQFAQKVIESCEVNNIVRQVCAYSFTSRYEFRFLLYFLAETGVELKQRLSQVLFESVRMACKPKDEEASSILRAYGCLDSARAQQLADDLCITPQAGGNTSLDVDLGKIQRGYSDLDAMGADYDIDLR